MTVTEMKKLKMGDKVVWPEGANGCTEAVGTVVELIDGTRYVQWPDTQRTYLHDKEACKYIMVARSLT